MRRRGALVSAMVAVIAVLSPLGAAGVAAPLEAGTSNGWTPSNAPAPSVLPNGQTPVSMELNGTSCSSADLCLSVGSVSDVGLQFYPLAEVYTDGEWSPEVLPLPADGVSGVLYAVSCSADGSCAAVGDYNAIDSSPDIEYQMGLLETLTDGVWTAQEATLPSGPDSGLVNLNAVACPSPTLCFGLGQYSDFTTNGPPVGLLYQWDGTSWQEVTLPTLDDYVNLNLNSISCADVSDCVAVGSYSDPSDTNSWPYALILTYTDGVWSAMDAPTPANAANGPVTVGETTYEAMNYLTSVDCPQLGACVAVGEYLDLSADFDPLILMQDGSTWTSVEGPVPSDSEPNVFAGLSGVSCTGANSCVAVGTYWTGYQVYVPLLETDDGGTWNATAAPVPGSDAPDQPLAQPKLVPSARTVDGRLVERTTESSDTGASLNVSSCAVGGSCTAVGDDGSAGLIETGTPFDTSGPVTVTSVAPPFSPIGGGGQVTVTGSNFSPNAEIEFGTTTVSTTFVSSSELTATVPEQTTDGFVPVSVVEGSATSSAGLGVWYQGPPVIASLPLDVVGNQVLSLSGNNGLGQGGTDVTLYECATSTYSAQTCDPSSAVTAHVTSTGLFAGVPFHVVSGTVDAQSDSCGLATSGACYVVGVDPSGASGAAPLEFQPLSVKLSSKKLVVGNVADSIAASGFPIGDPVEAVECDGPSVTPSTLVTDCDERTAVTGIAHKSGVAFSPKSIRILEGSGYADAGSGTCNPGGTCSVAVVDLRNTSEYVVEPLTLATPSVSVSPTTVADADGVAVRVSPSGFPVGDQVELLECDTALPTGSTAANCDPATAKEGVSGTTGHVPPAELNVLTTATTPAYADAAGGVCEARDTVPHGDPCYIEAVDVTDGVFAADAPFGVR